MKLANNKILITGGASGIGLGLTERFLQEGNTVHVCGRREDVLKEFETKHPSVITFECDLTKSKEREKLFRRVTKNHPDLNMLVNNAGIQNRMTVDDKIFVHRAKNEIITNIEAPIHLTQLFMNLKSFNTVVNVTSGLSFVPFAKVPVYSAT